MFNQIKCILCQCEKKKIITELVVLEGLTESEIRLEA